MPHDRTKAIARPFGDHAGSPSSHPSGGLVNRSTVPPAEGSTAIPEGDGPIARTRYPPSGDQPTSRGDPANEITCRLVPSALPTPSWYPLSVSMTNASFFPSRDHDGPA